MTFINDDGYEEEDFNGEVFLNLENCESNSYNGSSMPITGIRLPTEEDDSKGES